MLAFNNDNEYVRSHIDNNILVNNSVGKKCIAWLLIYFISEWISERSKMIRNCIFSVFLVAILIENCNVLSYVLPYPYYEPARKQLFGEQLYEIGKQQQTKWAFPFIRRNAMFCFPSVSFDDISKKKNIDYSKLYLLFVCRKIVLICRMIIIISFEAFYMKII